MKSLDLKGTKYGRLTVIELANTTGKHRRWMCQCSCGKTKNILADSLRAGRSRSCGCLHNELLGHISTSHGKSKTNEYYSWAAMIQRCTNSKIKGFKNYGGRGINVFDEWLNFESFLKHIGPRPKGTSLERINNELGYQPGNVKWATRSEQNNNTRRSRKLTYDGLTLNMMQWAKKSGVEYCTLKRRIYRGWPIEKAIIP